MDDLDLTYTITLSDGTILENLKKSGNNFIADYTVTEAVFDGKLSVVKIGCSNGLMEELHNVELVQVAEYPTGYYFILHEPTEAEIAARKIRADIDYLALMTDTDLEEA